MRKKRGQYCCCQQIIAAEAQHAIFVFQGKIINVDEGIWEILKV